MPDVPKPFSAREHARYVEDTLVSQEHAVEVPYEQRRRGDFVVYKYGTYGHIGVLLSGDRLFEQNANVGGVARRWVDGAWVYSARIGTLGESWRPVRPNIYRIKSYAEKGSELMIIQNAENWYGRCNRTHWLIRGRELDRSVFAQLVGKEFLTFVEVCSDDPEANMVQGWQELGKVATKDDWRGQIYGLIDQVKALSSRPTAEELKAVKDSIDGFKKQADEATKRAEEAEKKSTALEAEHIEAQKAGNAFVRWIGEQIAKITGGSK